MYDAPNVTPRLIVKILAMISSLTHAVLPWRLHSRALAWDKERLIRKVNHKWDEKVVLSKEAYEVLVFWINTLQTHYSRPIIKPPVDYLYLYLSSKGMEACNRWKRWVTWAHTNSVDPTTESQPNLATFLLTLSGSIQSKQASRY
eukprot:TRINITY_DN9748_c0_g1_i1.p1 TRINITY_DN9748_c0_g1~~TRINITY_DN9748_c0_g1_i1.p1  ORF type:complete len:145 (-),score=10.23 TRINITY_DN9748_c0_g1_i1:23-457(-)